jgi:hypothetical protein
MNHKVHTKENLLIIEIYGVENGFAQDILHQIQEQIHLIRRPFCLIMDYHDLDSKGLVLPHAELAAFIQIIELLDRTGRTHAIWIHHTPSKNTEILSKLITLHSIAYNKAAHAHNLPEAEKAAKKIMKK